jgi:hypothetical protein
MYLAGMKWVNMSIVKIDPVYIRFKVIENVGTYARELLQYSPLFHLELTVRVDLVDIVDIFMPCYHFERAGANFTMHDENFTLFT